MTDPDSWFRQVQRARKNIAKEERGNKRREKEMGAFVEAIHGIEEMAMRPIFEYADELGAQWGDSVDLKEYRGHFFQWFDGVDWHFIYPVPADVGNHELDRTYKVENFDTIRTLYLDQTQEYLKKNYKPRGERF